MTRQQLLTWCQILAPDFAITRRSATGNGTVQIRATCTVQGHVRDGRGRVVGRTQAAHELIVDVPGHLASEDFLDAIEMRALEACARKLESFT